MFSIELKISFISNSLIYFFNKMKIFSRATLDVFSTLDKKYSRIASDNIEPKRLFIILCILNRVLGFSIFDFGLVRIESKVYTT